MDFAYHQRLAGPARPQRPAPDAAALPGDALAYFCHALATDLGAARATYVTPVRLAAVADEGGVRAREREVGSGRWWWAVGEALWVSLLTAEQKAAARAEFEAWRRAAEPTFCRVPVGYRGRRRQPTVSRQKK
jgi:hypothetical protein